MSRTSGAKAEVDKSRPCIRASFTKSALAALADLEPDVRERVRARIPLALRDRIEAASRTDWLDGETLITIDAALFDELGERGVTEFWRGFTRASTRVPLLRPIADSAIRLFASPPGLFKVVPMSWKMMTRDFGRIRVASSDGENCVRIEMSAVPSLSRPELFSLGHTGSYEGVLDLVGATGTVTADVSSIGTGTYRYEVRWA